MMIELTKNSVEEKYTVANGYKADAKVFHLVHYHTAYYCIIQTPHPTLVFLLHTSCSRWMKIED